MQRNGTVANNKLHGKNDDPEVEDKTYVLYPNSVFILIDVFLQTN